MNRHIQPDEEGTPEQLLETLGLSPGTLKVIREAYRRVRAKQTPAERLAGELEARLQEQEPDWLEDTAESLRQLGEVIGALERSLQKPELPVGERIMLEDAQFALIQQRERLRRDWQTLLAHPFPARN